MDYPDHTPYGICTCDACEKNQLRQRVQELENERLEQQEKLCGCIVNLGQLRAERDEWEANSGQWEQEYYKVSKERDKATQYWQIAEGRCDALKQQRDELVAALEFARQGYQAASENGDPDEVEWAEMYLRSIDTAIASVKEK